MKMNFIIYDVENLTKTNESNNIDYLFLFTETVTETLSQERIILISALSVIGFVLLVQAIHNIVNACCKPKRKV